MAKYKKNLTLSLGLISAQVDLDVVAPRQRTGLSRICREHHVKLNQKYVCQGTADAEPHDVPWGEWELGMDTGDGWKIPKVEEKPEVEVKAGLTLVPVPRKDLEAHTIEGEGMYYAEPSNDLALQTWTILNKIVAKGKVALVAKAAIRGGTNEKIWRLGTFNNYLVLREIRFPEAIMPAPAIKEFKVDRDTLAMAESFIEGLTKEWADFDTTDEMARRMEEWMSGGTDVDGVKPAQAPAFDLKAALAAELGK